MPALSDDQHALLDTQITPYHIGNRTQSTALLAWFIENVLREDPDSVEDAICDGGGDKGIDALLFDEDANELVVLQAKHRRGAGKTQGDSDLKGFVGVAAYFESGETLDALLASSPNEELINLIARLELRRRIGETSPKVRLVFVSNAAADSSADSYIATLEGREPGFELWDGRRLIEVARRTERPDLLPEAATLEATALIDTGLSEDVRMVVALVPATELVRLPGISDLTIFDLNVRLGLGNTKINRELRQTIRTSTEHALFPAFHNGLTLLTAAFAVDDTTITLDGVGVVNGCQSLLSLWHERAELTPDLSLIVKVIELHDRGDLADRITYRSNNQNPVNMRDLRANDRIQRDLQQAVEERYGALLFYDIRRGQSPGDADHVLDNQLAAQLLMATWIGEPWNAVRKVKLFDQEYHRVFRRADADILFLAFLVGSAIDRVRKRLLPQLQTSFASVRFALAHLIAVHLRQSPEGERLLETPGQWLPARIGEVAAELDRLAEFAVDETNHFIEARLEAAREADAPPFDPKTIFKASSGVRDLEKQLVHSIKAVARRPDIPVYFDLASN